jgi:hypothetical protein
MAEEILTYKCSVCSCSFTEDEGGVDGHFGMLPVAFCPTCFSCMIDMAEQYMDVGDMEFEEEEELSEEAEEVFEALKGVQHIVINRCHGGFGLSHKGELEYLKRAGIAYTLQDRVSRDDTQRFGSAIVLANGDSFYSRNIERDDPALVATVQALGEEANGDFANLRVVKIPGDVEWEIDEYDGLEWVAEQHRTWQ